MLNTRVEARNRRAIDQYDRQLQLCVPVVSTTDDAYTLTVENSTASSYSLTVMTIVAAVMVPLVLAYQGWTYWVFRARIKGPAETAPAG